MTRHEFKLPDVGEGVAEGELVEWLVAEGDTVSEDQPVAEVETDKAVVDVPSPYNGTVVELHWNPGDIVPVGDVFVTFETEPDAVEDTETEEEPSPDEEPVTEPESTTDESAESGEGRVFAPPRVRRLARELEVDLERVSGSGPSGRITEADVREAADQAETGTPESEP